MPPRARPATRSPALRKRPAKHVEADKKVTRLHSFKELAAVQLRTLGLVELAQASYYEGHIKLAGYVEGLGKDDGYLTFRATGTQSDHMTEFLSDPKRCIFHLHVCGPDCGRKETGPDIIHAAGYWLVEEDRRPWHTMYEEVEARPGAVDEMSSLRKLHEEQKKREAGEDPPPSEGSEKQKKKKKKKAREKEKKASKLHLRKDEVEGDAEGHDYERGQKPLRAIFGRTCLDPEVSSTLKMLKRARRFSNKSSKKKRQSSSGDASSSSSSSDSEDEDLEEGLFEERRKALKLTGRFPGSLASQTISSMKEATLTLAGTLHSQDKRSLPPLFTQYFRTELQGLCGPSMCQELLTLCQGADLLLQGHIARTVDLLAQRVKALEQQSRGGHWSVARQLELVSADATGLSQGPESAEAARNAREELRNRLASQRPYGSTGRERGEASSGKGKDRYVPPNEKGKGDKGKKGKGKAKQKE